VFLVGVGGGGGGGEEQKSRKYGILKGCTNCF
jgi:hypothetical protein